MPSSDNTPITFGYHLERIDRENGEFEIYVKCYSDFAKKGLLFRTPNDDIIIKKNGSIKAISGTLLKKHEGKNRFSSLTSEQVNLLNFHQTKAARKLALDQQVKLDQVTDFDTALSLRAASMLCLLLLLNSRSRILKTDNEKTDDEVTKKRKLGQFGSAPSVKLNTNHF